GFFFIALSAVPRRSRHGVALWAVQLLAASVGCAKQIPHHPSRIPQPFKGPFFWTSTKAQTVYYVFVEDSDGNKRSGWVRCGSCWFGLLSDNVEVRWDD